MYPRILVRTRPRTTKNIGVNNFRLPTHIFISAGKKTTEIKFLRLCDAFFVYFGLYGSLSLEH